MKKLIYLMALAPLFLTSCGESEDVKNCKIHYCDIQKLEERQSKGEDVAAEIEQKKSFLEINKGLAIESGTSDIDQILADCKCD